MTEQKIPDEVLDALVENTKTIDANTTLLTEINASKEKNEKREENIVAKTKVQPNLTTNEKARYANIGKELFKPFFIALDDLIKKEKKRSEMTVSDKKQSIKFFAQKEEKEKEDKSEGKSFWSKVLTLLPLIAVIGYAFKDEIVSFFTKMWDSIKGTFNKVLDFFDFENTSSPIGSIVSSIKSLINDTWEKIEPIFSKLGNLASDIWESIKGGWDTFITGPDGIINFGIKIISGISNFVKNSFNVISDAITSYVIEPIKGLIGDSKKEADEAALEAMQDIQVTSDQIKNDNKIKQELISNKALTSASAFDKAIEDSAKKIRDNAEEAAKAQGLEIDKSGKITQDSIKAQVAKETISKYLEENGTSFTKLKEDQQKEIIDMMSEHITITNEGKANVDISEFIKSIKDTKSDGIFSDSDEVNLLQELEGEESYNKIRSYAEASLNKMSQIGTDLQSAKNLENLSEEEKFELRLKAAIEAGQATEFRFLEGRKMILDSTEAIKNSFINYHFDVERAYTSTWEDFIKKFMGLFTISIDTDNPQDNSVNNYTISPIHKNSIKSMSNELIALAHDSVKTIIEQNNILNKIKELLSKPQDSSENSAPNVIMTPPNPPATNNSAGSVIKTGKQLVSSLWTASTPWA